MKRKTIEIFEKIMPVIVKILEKAPITLALIVTAFSFYVKLSSENWQLLTNCWVIIAALIGLAYIAKEYRMTILKNELEVKDKELKKEKTALMIAMRDCD